MRLEPGDCVLDLACGTGLNIHFMLGTLRPENITGVDYSNDMLEVARRKYPGVQFARENVANYQVKDRYDKIVCTYSLSIIDEWEKTILNARESLKKDGVLLILDFHEWRHLRFVYRVFGWWLRRHGVDAERSPMPLLEKHFSKVEKLILNGGYNYIIVARK